MPSKRPLQQKVLLRLDNDLFSKIEEFRFIHRFEDRTKAIRWLLEYALSQNPKPKK